MIAELPIHYAMIFFLGMLVYAPITLISNGKYKAGLKAAGAICVSALMLATTARLATIIYPSIVAPKSATTRIQLSPPQTTEVTTTKSRTQSAGRKRLGHRCTTGLRKPETKSEIR